MWDKKSKEIHDIFEGDSCVVNVIEGHPHLPLVAVSGIDTTVKVCTSIASLLEHSLTSSIAICTGAWGTSLLSHEQRQVYITAKH